jgi:hypothetical protein
MTKTRRTLTRASVALVVVSLLAACGGGGSSSDPVSAGEAVDPVTGEAVYPLTGLPVTDPAAAARVAIAAKIDNSPIARPQSGLNKADIVFEENVEGLTRFAAVFHSQGSDPVGPLRSGRTQDVDILTSFSKPLFAWSGGNYRVTKIINASTLVNVGYSASKGKGGYYREATQKAPHNLYAKTTDLWTLAPQGAVPPPQQFIYRSNSDAKPATSVAVDGAKVTMYGGVRIFWKWDAASGNFLRFTENSKRVLEPHVSDGAQINTKNIFVPTVRYLRSKADRKSPHAVTTGTGKGFVLTDGGLIAVRWSRPKAEQPFSIVDENGAVVRMTPGRTWVEIASPNTLAQVDIGVDPTKVKWPTT